MSDYYPEPEAVLDLFVACRTTDPATSREAGDQARRFVTGHARKVLLALEQGPAGQTELAERCQMLPHQVNKRLADLRRAGLAEPTGRRVLNEGGFRERVWQVKPGDPLTAGG